MEPFETLTDAEDWMDRHASGQISVYIEGGGFLPGVYVERIRCTLGWSRLFLHDARFPRGFRVR